MKKTKFLILSSVLFASACSPANLSNLPKTNGSESLAFSELGADFGEVIIGDTIQKELVITNTGKSSVKDLSVSFNLGQKLSIQENTCVGTLQTGGFCKIKIVYSADQTAQISGNYSVSYTDDSAKVKSFEIKGKAVTKAVLSFSSQQVNFGDVPVTGEKTSIVNISNSGGATAELRLKNILGEKFSFSGGAFPGTNGTCSDKLLGNSSCSVSLKIKPDSVGQVLGSLSLSYFDGKIEKETSVVSLSALGKLPANINSNSVGSFDQTVLGSNKTKQVVFANSGEMSAQINVVSVNGIGYAIDNTIPVSGLRCSQGLTLGVGQSCSTSLRFSPNSAGTFDGSLGLVYNNGVESKAVNFVLSAQSVTPSLVKLVGQSPVSFGQSTIGLKVLKELVFENTGGRASDTFSVSALGGTYNFEGGSFPGAGGTCQSTIQAGSTCKVVLSHVASGVGTDNRPISFSYNNGLNLVTEQLILTSSTTGQASLVFSAGQAQSAGIIALNSSKVLDVELKNLGLSSATGVLIQQINKFGTQNEQTLTLSLPGCTQMNSSTSCLIPVTVLGDSLGPILTKILVSYTDSSGSSRSNSLSITGSVDIFSELASDTSAYNFQEVFTTSVNEKIVVLSNTGTTKITGIQGVLSGNGLTYKGGAYPGTAGTCSLELNAGQTCSLVLSYSPNQTSVLSGALSVSYFNQFETRNLSVQFSGSAKSVATFSASVGNIGLGRVELGSAVPFQITYSNNGDVPASLLSVTNLQDPFSFSGVNPETVGVFPGVGGTCSDLLAQGQSCTVTAIYRPSLAGLSSSDLVISYNNGLEDKTTSVQLSGTGVNVASLAGASLFDFGVVSVGEPMETTFTITNSGGEHATGVSISSSSLMVSIIGDTCGGLIAKNTSCNVSVRYSPQIEGETLSSALTIGYNNGVAQVTKSISLLGIGGVPKLGDLVLSSVGVYDFGEVPINQARFFTVDVTNFGTGEASAVGLGQMAPPYFLVPSLGVNPDCGLIILPGETCSVTVEFAPIERFSYSQNLTLSYNDGLVQRSQTLELTGLGVFVPGTIDEGFGTLGSVVIQVPGAISSYATGVYAQPNGKIVLGGTALIPEDFIFSTRLNTDGTLDQTYGNGIGYLVDNNFAQGAGSYKSIGLSSGSMLHLGYSGPSFMVSKINFAGIMDGTFGLGGHTAQPVVNRPDYAYSGIELADGKILSVGTWNEDAYIQKMLPNGSLDTTFNGTGFFSLDVDQSLGLDEVRFVLEQSNGKYVFGGGSMIGAAGMNGTLMRVNSDGTLDQTFGNQGVVLVNQMGLGEKYITDAILVEDDKVLALVLAQNNAFGFELAEFEMYLAKFNSDGTYDLTFNNGLGFVHLSNWGSSGLISDFRVIKQADGKILIAGNKNNGFGYDIAVMRVLPNGSMDLAFGTGGEYVVPDSESFSDYSIALAVQPDGEILLGGKRTAGFNVDEIILTRIHR